MRRTPITHGTHGFDADASRLARPASPAVPAALTWVTLTLARCEEHPEGSAGRGYDIVAPLGPDGRLDATLWHGTRDRCRLRRFWPGKSERHGRLVHRAGGEGGATWLIDYEDWTNEDDEAGYRLGTHAFVEGELVSILQAGEGEFLTFRVARVVPTGVGGHAGSPE